MFCEPFKFVGIQLVKMDLDKDFNHSFQRKNIDSYHRTESHVRKVLGISDKI